jgi:hypothetical protein
MGRIAEANDSSGIPLGRYSNVGRGGPVSSRKLGPTSYHNQALLDDGPKIAPMYFSSAKLNLTTT